MTVHSEALLRAWERRRKAKPPLVTDDGFGPHALVIDEQTGCQLWQGAMYYHQPEAGYRGRKVNPRVIAYKRTGRTVPAGYRLVPVCGQDRCINPDHNEPRPKRRPPAPPKARDVKPTPLRQQFAGGLPTERPPGISERDWQAFTAIVAGKTYAEVAAELGISRQRAHRLVERAR